MLLIQKLHSQFGKSFVPAIIATAFAVMSGKAATIVAYVEAPTVQSSSVSGITTETFDSLATGTYNKSTSSSIGTYQASSSAKFAILSADQFGGVGGAGHYFAVGAESQSTGPVLLNLKAESNYFGFWWSAGDKYNSITFLQDGAVYATFTTDQIVNMLPRNVSSTVTAINGTKYNTFNYYGNPNSAQDVYEPFAYVDIIANGLSFDQVEFSNGVLNSGFESDNHSVGVNVTDPPGGDVIVQNVPLSPAALAPEPTTLLLLGGGLLTVAFKLRRSLVL